MYRLFITTFVLILATGCANPPASASFDSQEGGSVFATDAECDATSVQLYVGQNWRDSLDDDLRRASTSQTLRLLKPGQVITLEFNPYRLNAVIDAQGVITSLYCS